MLAEINIPIAEGDDGQTRGFVKAIRRDSLRQGGVLQNRESGKLPDFPWLLAAPPE